MFWYWSRVLLKIWIIFLQNCIFLHFQGYKMRQYTGGYKWFCETGRLWIGEGGFLGNQYDVLISLDYFGCLKSFFHVFPQATKLNDIKSCKGTPFWMAPEVVFTDPSWLVICANNNLISRTNAWTWTFYSQRTAILLAIELAFTPIP